MQGEPVSGSLPVNIGVRDGFVNIEGEPACQPRPPCAPLCSHALAKTRFSPTHLSCRSGRNRDVPTRDGQRAWHSVSGGVGPAALPTELGLRGGRFGNL